MFSDANIIARNLLVFSYFLSNITKCDDESIVLKQVIAIKAALSPAYPTSADIMRFLHKEESHLFMWKNGMTNNR